MRNHFNPKPHVRNPVKIKKNNKLNDRETAQFISDMLMELRQLAKSSNLATLQSLIELSYYEAFAIGNPVALPPEEIERLNELQNEGRRHAMSMR